MFVSTKKITSNADATVVKIQVNVILLIWLSLKIWLRLGNPANWYCSPNIISNNQKWGICPIKKKVATKRISSEVKLPPAAPQPIIGGKAPTNEPGITANAVTFFNGV